VFIIPADDSPFCGGMKGFCGGIDIGDPLGLHSSQGVTTSTSSILQLITPVSERRAVEATAGNRVRQMLRIHRPTRMPDPLPTDGRL
jgi:hypothetical protein